MRAERLLWLLLLVPGVPALTVHDPADDVEVRAQDQPLTTTSEAPWLDLTQARMWWEGDELVVEIDIGADPRPDLPGIDPGAPRGEVHFLVDDVPFHVRLLPVGQAPVYRGVDRVGPAEAYSNADGTMVGARIPGELLLPPEQLARGATIRWVGAFAAYDGCYPGCGLVHLRDEMDGEPDESLVKPSASIALGPLTLRPEPAVRLSNGGAEVAVFGLIVENPSQADASLRLQPAAPADWTVYAPSPAHVRPGTTWLPFVVSVPSAHVHGRAEGLRIEASLGNATTSIPFQYGFLQNAQVAGHHPYLYLHAGTVPDPPRGDNWKIWMNVEREDAEANQDDKAFEGVPANLDFDLDGALLVGLDFQPGPVEAHLEVQIGAADRAAAISAGVYYCDPSLIDDDPASGGPGCHNGAFRALAQTRHPVDLAPGRHAVDIPIPVTEGVDRVPPQTGASLRFRLVVEFTETSPGFVGGGSVGDTRIWTRSSHIRMPLVDYRDNVSSTPAGHNLTAPGSLQVTPGSRIDVPVTVSGGDGELQGALFVAAPGWSAAAPASLDGRNDALRLEVPADAQPGAYSASVVAWAAEGAAILPIDIVVVDGPPQIETAGRDAGAPGPWPLAALALLLARGRRWRR